MHVMLCHKIVKGCDFVKNIEKIIAEFKNRTELTCAKIVIEDGVVPSVLDDKLGGVPYFPHDVEYPMDSNGKPMALLLQVDLKNIMIDDFPKDGILEIFIGDLDHYPTESKIFIFEKGKPQKQNLPEINMVYPVVNIPLKFKLQNCKCYMPIYDYRFTEVFNQVIKSINGADATVTNDDMCKMYDNTNLQNPYACIGGYADFTQDDMRTHDSNRDFCVFKLDSYLHKSIEIGDSGILTVTISKDDLKNGRMEKAVVDWDCY